MARTKTKYPVTSEEDVRDLKSAILRYDSQLKTLKSKGLEGSEEWIRVLSRRVWAYGQLGDTTLGPLLAKRLASAVKGSNLEHSDHGSFANNHLTVFAHLLREKSDFSGALRLDLPALNYLDRMGGTLDDDYAFSVGAVARDYEGLGDREKAITLLEDYKARLDLEPRWYTPKERESLADLIVYRRRARRSTR